MSIDLAKFNEFSVALPGKVHGTALDHLLKYQRMGHRQENLCFALWRPSAGSTRFTALVHDLVLPLPHELQLNGNVAFGGEYLNRASRIAADAKSGLVLMHNHFTPGWQGMSPDDLSTERERSPFALSSTGLPLCGMTLGIDGAWSARFWPRTGPKRYERLWCRNVRIVGVQISATFHPELAPVPAGREELLRTISAWGEKHQATLSRTRVGVVGLGSVGRLVLESLARMGIKRVVLIDFDIIERVNLDRLLGAYPEDARDMVLKVESAKQGFLCAATALNAEAISAPYAVTEPAGFCAALDCDVLFSCVDRPWGRQVLNHIAYAHLIPVVDGGILIRSPGGRFKGANWSVRTAGPGRCCLKCCGQFDPGLVDTERKGLLDDPIYFEQLPLAERGEASQNIFPFSMCTAGHEMVQFVALVAGLLDRPDLGEQRYHYNIAEMKSGEFRCDAGCSYADRIATGEDMYPRDTMLGLHPKAEEIRRILKGRIAQPKAVRRGPWSRMKSWFQRHKR